MKKVSSDIQTYFILNTIDQKNFEEKINELSKKNDQLQEENNQLLEKINKQQESINEAWNRINDLLQLIPDRDSIVKIYKSLDKGKRRLKRKKNL